MWRHSGPNHLISGAVTYQLTPGPRPTELTCGQHGNAPGCWQLSYRACAKPRRRGATASAGGRCVGRVQPDQRPFRRQPAFPVLGRLGWTPAPGRADRGGVWRAAAYPCGQRPTLCRASPRVLSRSAADHIEAVNAAAALRRGIALTLSCAALLVAAVGATWYGPGRDEPGLQITTPSGTVCGSVVALSDGILTLRTAAGQVTAHLRRGLDNAGRGTLPMTSSARPSRSAAIRKLHAYEATGDLEDLGTAITLFQQAVDQISAHDWTERKGSATSPQLCNCVLRAPAVSPTLGQRSPRPVMPSRCSARTSLGCHCTCPIWVMRCGCGMRPPGGSPISRKPFQRVAAPCRRLLLITAVAASACQTSHMPLPSVRAHRPPRDLDEAVEVGDQAVVLAPRDDPTLTRLQSNLGVALRERYEYVGPPDLQTAADLAMQAVAGTLPGHPDRAGMLSNLALALYQQYESGRRAEDLTHAITAARAALALTPGDHPDRPMYALNLAVLLRSGAAVSNDSVDLDEAIGSARYAVTLLPEKHPTGQHPCPRSVAPTACATTSCTTPQTPAPPSIHAERRSRSRPLRQ